MKLSNKYIAFASVALLMASCDLDKFPEGDYISEEQKEDIINGRPNLITAEVNAMAAKLNLLVRFQMMPLLIIMTMEFLPCL